MMSSDQIARRRGIRLATPPLPAPRNTFFKFFVSSPQPLFIQSVPLQNCFPKIKLRRKCTILSEACRRYRPIRLHNSYPLVGDIPYYAVLSVEQPQWSHIDPLRTVNLKWIFFSLRATFRAINGLQQPRKYRLPMGSTHIHKLWKFSRSDFDWIISDLQSAETTSSHPNQRKRCNLV